MNQQLVLAFFIALCGLAVADKEVFEVLKGHGSDPHVPISSEWPAPVSHDVHHVGSTYEYVPTYQQETTYTFPQPYDTVEDELQFSPLTILLGLLPIPKIVSLKLASSILWIISNIKMLLLGVGLTVAVCSFTNFCHISWQPHLHHEFRSFATPARIDAATSFVKKAIEKYTSLQGSSEVKAVEP